MVPLFVVHVSWVSVVLPLFGVVLLGVCVSVHVSVVLVAICCLLLQSVSLLSASVVPVYAASCVVLPILCWVLVLHGSAVLLWLQFLFGAVLLSDVVQSDLCFVWTLCGAWWWR